MSQISSVFAFNVYYFFTKTKETFNYSDFFIHMFNKDNKFLYLK